MRKMVTLLRASVSMAVIGWLLAAVNWASLSSDLTNAEFQWLLMAHLLSPLTVLVGVWKWRLLMQARGFDIATSRLVRYFLIGHFFSNFLPTNVGGDVVRISLVTRHIGRPHWPIAVAGVLVERLTGLLGMFLVLPMAAAVNYAWLTSLNIEFPLIAMAGCFLLIIWLIFSDAGVWMLARVQRVPLAERPVRLIRKLHDAVLGFRGHRRELIVCTGLAVLFYFAAAIQIWLLLLAFPHVDVPWTTQLVTLGVVSLVSLLPISINGYGIQEGTYVFFFVSLGFSYDEALVLALANRLLALAIAVVGGLLFATAGLGVSDLRDRSASGQGA